MGQEGQGVGQEGRRLRLLHLRRQGAQSGGRAGADRKGLKAVPLTGRRRRPIVNAMVNYQASGLDRTFAALADPTRRALLAGLEGEDNLTISELAKPFPVSLPAIMK